MKSFFNLVVIILKFFSSIFKTSYIKMNIIIFYIIIPLSWIVLLDAIFKFHFFKIVFIFGYIILFLLIKNWNEFCAWIFKKSVILLNYPYKITEEEYKRFFMGPYYIKNSIFICIVVPIIIYILLVILLV